MKTEVIRQRLVARMEELARRAAQTGADLRREGEPLSADLDEQAVQLENDEVLQGLNDSAQREMGQIKHALSRVASGLYFSCTRCGSAIEAQRLEAIPYTDTCSDCARVHEHEARATVP